MWILSFGVRLLSYLQVLLLSLKWLATDLCLSVCLSVCLSLSLSLSPIFTQNSLRPSFEYHTQSFTFFGHCINFKKLIKTLCIHSFALWRRKIQHDKRFLLAVPQSVHVDHSAVEASHTQPDSSPDPASLLGKLLQYEQHDCVHAYPNMQTAVYLPENRRNSQIAAIRFIVWTVTNLVPGWAANPSEVCILKNLVIISLSF